MFDVGALVFKIQSAGAAVFQRDLEQADKSVKKLESSSKSAKTAIDGQGTATDELGKKSRRSSEEQEKQRQATEGQVQAAKNLSLALIAGGAAIAAVVGLSVAKYADFDQQLSSTAAASMATAAEQKQLGEAALEAGAKSAYSATEAAAAQEELVKAGLSVSEVINGSLGGALSLAAAGNLQVARSAEVMATTLKQFRLPAENAAHVSDVLAAAAGKAQGSVDDMSLALSYVGPVANSAGWSLEETAGTLAYFASQGILGEKAGTSLRGVLATLSSPSQQAAKVMEQYGIAVYDSNGQMKDSAGLAQALRDAFAGLTDQERQLALGRIFGNEQLLGATLLYEGGAQAIDEWTGNVTDAGYAAEQAARKQDNLAGDIEKLGGAFDTALIKTGSGANDVLRDQVQILTSLVEWYGELPAEVHSGALMFGVVAGAMALTAGAAVGLRAKYVELNAQMSKTNLSLGRTAAIGGAVGLALAGVVTVLTVFAQRQAEAQARVEGFRTTLDQATGVITDSTREMAVALLQADQGIDLLFGKISRGNAADAAERLGVSMTTATDAAVGQADALEELSVFMKAAEGDEKALQAVMKQTGLSRTDAAIQVSLLADGIRQASGDIDQARRKQQQANEVTEEAAPAAKSAAEGYLAAADGADELQGELSNLIDEIMSANEANLDTREANRRLIESFADFDEGLKEHGRTLDLSTEAGRANEENLDAIAQAAIESAKSITDAGGSYEEYRASLESSRQALLDRIEDLGITGQAAEDLADEILEIPSETEWKMVAETTEAANRIQRIQDAIAGLRDKTVRITVARPDGVELSDRQIAQQFGFGSADGNLVEAYANGGLREHHVAQLARAGAWRVWAEPETGGESYIPHAPSKRQRSEQIMAETAAILGGVYIPSGASRFADGGMTRRDPLAAAPPLIGQLTVHGHELNEAQFARKVAKMVREEIEQGFGSW